MEEHTTNKGIDDLLKDAVESSAYLTHYLIKVKHSTEWEEAETAMALVYIYLTDLCSLAHSVNDLIVAQKI